MNLNLVGSIYMYGRFCIKFPQSRMKGEQHKFIDLIIVKMLLILWYMIQRIYFICSIIEAGVNTNIDY